MIAQPIIKSQPDIGSNNTSKTPNPKPMRQVASSFFSNLPIYYLLCNIICKYKLKGYLCELKKKEKNTSLKISFVLLYICHLIVRRRKYGEK